MQTVRPLTFTDASSSNRKLENLSIIGKHTDDAQLQLDAPVQITGALIADQDLSITGTLVTSTIDTLDSLSLQTSGSTRLNIDATGNASFSGNLTIQGDVSIEGTTTTVNATQVDIGDNIILLNAGADEASPASLDAGFEIERGSDTNVSMLWNETDDRWDATGAFNAATLQEGGTSIGSLYLGISDVAADSTLLAGNPASHYAAVADVLRLDGTAPMAGALNMNNLAITGVADPTANGDAANKKYVDDANTSMSTFVTDSIAAANSIMTTFVTDSVNAVDVSSDIETANTAMTTFVTDSVETANSVMTTFVTDSVATANSAMTVYVDNAVSGATITGLVRTPSDENGNVVWTFS